MNLTRPTLVGTLVVLCGAPLAALAQQGVPAARRSPAVIAVEVRIGAVLASNSGQGFDKRLASLRRQFNTLFPYSSYRLVKEERQRVPWGGRVGFDIPGGRYVLVIPKEFKDERVSMKVVVISGTRPVVDTLLSLRNRGTLLIGGPREPDGVLILSIGATTVP